MDLLKCPPSFLFSILIFILEKKNKGDKTIKIITNNSKLQHSPHITNNQITQKNPNYCLRVLQKQIL